MIDFIIGAGITAVLLLLGITAGRSAEKRHLKHLDEREATLRHIPVDNRKTVAQPEQVTAVTLLCGQAVIATDYFKSFAMGLRTLVGGEAKSAETLLQRARREALLRVVEQARDAGYHEVWNVRFQFSNIAMKNGNRGAMQVEMLAFATAVRRTDAPPRPNAHPL